MAKIAKIKEQPDGSFLYEGIHFTDYDSAYKTFLADRKDTNPDDDWQGGPVEIIYNGDGTKDLGYFITRYLSTAEGTMLRLETELHVSRQTIYDWAKGAMPRGKLAPQVVAILAMTDAEYVECAAIAARRKARQDLGISSQKSA